MVHHYCVQDEEENEIIILNPFMIPLTRLKKVRKRCWWSYNYIDSGIYILPSEKGSQTTHVVLTVVIRDVNFKCHIIIDIFYCQKLQETLQSLIGAYLIHSAVCGLFWHCTENSLTMMRWDRFSWIFKVAAASELGIIWRRVESKNIDLCSCSVAIMNAVGKICASEGYVLYLAKI